MRIFHILNGDAIADKFPVEKIAGQIIVIREAFVEGPVAENLNDEFWERRLAFLSAAYGADKDDYEEQFLSQLRIMDQIKDGDEVNLWFEDDLFCLVNMWFAIGYLSKRIKPVYFRIFPVRDNEKWIGFAATDNFLDIYLRKEKFDEDDIVLSNHMWEAYVMNDREKLKALSYSESGVFRFLPEVIQAHLDRNPADGSMGRPNKTLIDILNAGTTDFYEIFEAFWKKESIYGFGDMQVYHMLREMEIDIE